MDPTITLSSDEEMTISDSEMEKILVVKVGNLLI